MIEPMKDQNSNTNILHKEHILQIQNSKIQTTGEELNLKISCRGNRNLPQSFFGELFLLVFLFACTQTAKNAKEKERELILKNNIKCITEYVINMRQGTEEKEHVNHVKLFNSKGFITQETFFLADGSMDFFATNDYDKNDNLILTKAMKPDSSFFYKETKIYDENNNMIEKAYFEGANDSFFYRNTATYDSKGRMMEYFWWRPSGLRAKNKYAYDGMKMIENVEQDKDGKFSSKWIYKYDENENLIEAVQYYPDSIINSKITYAYNSNNELVKQTNYYRETILKMTTFEYDEKNLLIAKTEYSSAGKISAKFRYEYK